MRETDWLKSGVFDVVLVQRIFSLIVFALNIIIAGAMRLLYYSLSVIIQSDADAECSSVYCYYLRQV